MTTQLMFFPPKVIFGEGSLQEIGAEAAALGRRAFLVTLRPGRLTATGIVARARDLLGDAGVETVDYRIEVEPSIQTFDAGALKCRETACDLVIGLGGGSALDAAKGIAILAKHEHSMRDYVMGKATFRESGLPVIAIPTTAGTGSEASRVVVVNNVEARIKKSVNDHRLIPRVVLLDPELTLALPAGLTCSIGLDALSHAMESYVSQGANAFTEAVALQAIRMIGQALPCVVKDGQNIQSRGEMLFGSYLAGLSLSAGVGAAHILAQPVSAVTGLAHSQAIAILLPHVVQANAEYAMKKYAAVANALGEPVDVLGMKEAAAAVMRALKRFQEAGRIPRQLRDSGATERDLEDILEVALRWQMHIKTNPRPVDASMLREILRAAY